MFLETELTKRIKHLSRSAIGELVKELLTPRPVPTPEKESDPKVKSRTMQEEVAFQSLKVGPGTRWQHYKGGLYTVNFLELDTDDPNVIRVSYRSEKTGINWSRTLDEWLTPVEIEDKIGGVVVRTSKVQRFKLLP